MVQISQIEVQISLLLVLQVSAFSSFQLHRHQSDFESVSNSLFRSLIEGNPARTDELLRDGPAPHAVPLEVDLPAQLPLDVAQNVCHLLLFDVVAAEDG